MEIKPEEIIQTTESPIQLLYESLTNAETKRTYVNMLKKILCENLKNILVGDPLLVQQDQKKRHYRKNYSDADFEVRVNEFVRKANADPKWAESVILTLVTKQMERSRLEPTDPSIDCSRFR